MNSFRTTTVLLALALALAACGGGEGGSDEAADAIDGTIQIEASDLAFDHEQISAPSGEVEIELNNIGAAEHDFVVAEAGDEIVVTAGPGETATGSIELEPGTYTFYCSVPGHREAGMEGTLEVQ